MAGICEADGKVSDELSTCRVCGRHVCKNHLLKYGCAICNGTLTV